MGKWRDDRKNPAWCMNKGRRNSVSQSPEREKV